MAGGCAEGRGSGGGVLIRNPEGLPQGFIPPPASLRSSRPGESLPARGRAPKRKKGKELCGARVPWDPEGQTSRARPCGTLVGPPALPPGPPHGSPAGREAAQTLRPDIPATGTDPSSEAERARRASEKD
nr:uncharacterized protein LOC105105037 isoform X2 [Camelus dromedarius]